MKDFIDGFRLLNSEIGNDQQVSDKKYNVYTCFRLLNSEIGNDHFKGNDTIRLSWIGFRLLNSEIGNDHWRKFKWITKKNRFSSP